MNDDSIIIVCNPLSSQNEPILGQSLRGLHCIVDSMVSKLLVYQLVRLVPDIRVPVYRNNSYGLWLGLKFI